MKLLTLSTFTVFALLTCCVGFVFAQKPVLQTIDRISTSNDKVLTINGSLFGTDATKVSVRFGAARADIKQITDNLLQVRVPSGATYNNISVTNLTSGLTAYSREQFFLNFGGKSGFEVTNLVGQFNFPSTAPVQEGLNDLCLCDFDGDRKIDVAVANENSGFIVMYPNNSTGVGNISLGSKFSINTFSRTLHIRCADLNGDGKPEIIATEGGASGSKIFILRNNSTGPGSFLFTAQSITIAGSNVKQLAVADLDLDGKPELIVTSQSGNRVFILQNQSTLAAVSFALPITITIPGITNTDGLAVKDLNGDFLPEIVTSEFVSASNLYVLQNTSTPGVINISAGATINIGATIKNIVIGDLDGDGKSDISFTKQQPTTELGIVRNLSTSSSFQFAAPQYFITDGVPYGQDFGDLDGDGRPDIVIASNTKKTLTIFNNISTPGSINFERRLKESLTYPSRHIKIGDMDNDGKPDIAFTSVDDVNLSVPASKVSFFRNKSCMVPAVLPEGPLNICNTFPQELEATKGGGVSYEWTNLTTNTSVSGTNLYTPSATGDYQVTATAEANTCVEKSNIVKMTISAGTAANPLPDYDQPLCLGGNLSLKLNNNLGAGYTYKWTGPDGFEATGAAPVRNSARIIDGGEYTVEVIASGGCVARRESVIVKVIDKPNFLVTFPNSDILCPAQPKKLSVSPRSPDYTYEWFETTLGSLGVSEEYSTFVGGEFFVRATSNSCGNLESPKVKIISVGLITPAFTAPSSACKGQEITITDQSVYDTQAEIFYSWNFGDGTFLTNGPPVTHIYNSIGPKSIVLTLAYKNNMCPRSSPAHNITITDAPAVNITSPSSVYDICPNGTLPLNVAGTFTSYLWSTNETTPSINASAPGQYSVEVTAVNGCKLKTFRTIGAFAAPVVMASATPPVIEEGQSSRLYAEGVLSYTWSPAESLSSPTSQDPIATPLTSTTFTVSGVDFNGCQGVGTVELVVRGEAIVNKLRPGNFFSPNADAVNPFWMIGQINDYPQCGVTIYDDKGVKVFNAKPYLENWDGTFNGRRLPDGVYYYVIRCDGEENKPRMGSITILR